MISKMENDFEAFFWQSGNALVELKTGNHTARLQNKIYIGTSIPKVSMYSYMTTTICS